MTPTTSEREARVIDLLHRIERRATNHPDDTDDDLVRDMRHIVAHAREAIAALTREQRDGDDNELPGMWSHADFTGGDPDERSYAERNKRQQEAPGAVATVSYDTGIAIMKAGVNLEPGTELYTKLGGIRLTQPAPVDVRVVEDPSGFSAEMVLDEADNWTARHTGAEMLRNYAALLDGQPAGVDADPRIALFYEAVELQRTYYGDGAGLHLEMIDWAAKAAALGGGGGRG